jgi:hypothetical protein
MLTFYYNQDELRDRWKRCCKEWLRVADDNRVRQAEFNALPPGQRNPINRPKLIPSPPIPDECRGLMCGAMAKSTGKPCKRRDIYTNGRCPLHGGLSTGPRTVEGKAKSARNGLNPKRKRQSRQVSITHSDTKSIPDMIQNAN